MKISRETNLFLNKILNEWIPPFIRDQRWFGWLITRALYGNKAHLYMDFHSKIYEMTPEEVRAVYTQTHAVRLDRPTDLNEICVEKIKTHLLGQNILEVGCGRGYLSGLLTQAKITACDLVISPELENRYPDVTFIESPAETLPFPDAAFDTVISTHMLEHIRDLSAVIRELRRVTAKRLIIVVPRERAHLYTPSLHLHFFPYRYSFLLAFQPRGTYHLEDAGGDWFYYEDRAASDAANLA